MSIGYQPTPTESAKVRGARAFLMARGNLLLDDGLHGRDAARFADVGMLRKSVRRAHHVRAEPDLRGAAPRPGGRGLGLQPVQESEAHALRVLERAGRVERRAVEDAPVAVVVARPVEQREVVIDDPGEAVPVEQAAVGPQPALGARHPVVEAVLEPAAFLAVDLAAVDFDPEAVGLRRAVVLVLLRARDDVLLALAAALAGERVGEALHAVRLRLVGLRLRFAGPGDRLRADDVLGAGERQEVAELGGVDDELRPEPDQASVVEPLRGDGGDAIAFGRHRDRLRPPVDREPAAGHVRGQHLFDRRDGDARLEREPRDPAPARIELCVARARAATIVIADELAEPVVARGPAERLDVLVLVERRDALRGHLPAEPVGLLEQHDPAAAPRRGERGGDAAGAAAGDQDLAGLVARRRRADRPGAPRPPDRRSPAPA